MDAASIPGTNAELCVSQLFPKDAYNIGLSIFWSSRQVFVGQVVISGSYNYSMSYFFLLFMSSSFITVTNLRILIASALTSVRCCSISCTCPDFLPCLDVEAPSREGCPAIVNPKQSTNTHLLLLSESHLC